MGHRVLEKSLQSTLILGRKKSTPISVKKICGQRRGALKEKRGWEMSLEGKSNGLSSVGF